MYQPLDLFGTVEINPPYHIGNVGSLIDYDVLRCNDDIYDPIKHPNILAAEDGEC